MIRAVLQPAAFVFLTVLLFSSGHLSSITLATIEASNRGISGLGVGALTSLPFLGLFVGALFMPRLLRRTRHVRLIAIATSGCALSLMFLPYTESLLYLAILRFVYGFSAAGVWMCCDLWMAHLTEGTTSRGKIFAFYQMVALVGISFGQLLLLTVDGQLDFGFVIASAIMVGAVIPVCCTKLEEPPQESSSRTLPLKMAFKLVPLPLIGCFLTGLCFSNYAFIILHFQQSGVDSQRIATLGIVIVFAGAIGQLVVGYLSDKAKERRNVMLAITVLSIIALVGMIFSDINFWYVTVALGLLYGGCIVTMYPLNIALAGDFVSKDLFGPMAAKCFLLLNMGNALGPFLGGIVLSFFPEFGTFFFLIVALSILTFATLSPRALAQHTPAVTEEFAPMMPMGINPELSDPRAQVQESDEEQKTSK